MSGRPSKQRLRRHARKLRRAGLEPMTFVNPGDPLPEVAAVVIGRWLWRYRSELAPITSALALWLAGWLLNHWYSGWWPLIVILATTGAAVSLAAGRRLGMATRLERWYTAAASVIGGGWLAAATYLRPEFKPLPFVLVVSSFVLGIPWWAHRRRRAKVRVDRQLAAWPEIAGTVGLSGSRVMSAVVDVWGWRARFGLARGQTIDDVASQLPAIESALGTHRGAVRVYPTPDDLANRFELRVLNSDPHADAINWPGPAVQSVTEPFDLGPFEDAAPAKVLFLRRHVLLGGVSGSGKSGGLNVIMGNLAACRDVVIWAVDLKRGMELGPWAPCLARLAVTPAETRVLLADAVTVLEARAEQLAERGLRTWEPTPDEPALVIIVDEYAELAENAAAAVPDADSIARRGRAVAVNLIAATQRPTQQAMGQGALRSQMDVRICFRVRERRDVDLILGQGMLAAHWNAHSLNAPGKFLVSAPEHTSPRRARAYLLTDEAVRDTVTISAETRPALDDVSRRAIETRQTNPHPAAQGAYQAGPGRHRSTQPTWPEPTPDVEDPADALWQVLAEASPEGSTVADLLNATGMSRPTLYRHLAWLARQGDVDQPRRGRWRARVAHSGRPDAG